MFTSMSWNCCRTCLSGQSLNPIFQGAETSEKFKNAFFNATGLKIESGDGLPQHICTTCVSFINETFKFRKKCEDTEKLLKEKFKNQQICYKSESEYVKNENYMFASIDIGLLEDGSEFDQQFNEFDDNISLSALHYLSNYEEKDDKLKNGQHGEDLDAGQLKTSDLETSSKPKKERNKPKSVKKTINVKLKRDSKEKKTKNKVKEEIECEHCHKVLTSRLSLRNHYKIHTGFDVVCEHCGKKFITRRLLLMHCRAKHGYEKVDKCSYCDYRASNAEQVKIHERLHTGEKPFRCEQCGADFHRNSSYLQHVAIHLPERSVQCSLCPARFKSVTLMRIHRSRHKPPAYRYKCLECGGWFARRRNVARHLQRAHRLHAAHDRIAREHLQ